MIRNTQRFSFSLLLFLLLIVQMILPQQAVAQSALQQQFQNPSGDAKPMTLWYWMFGALSKEAMTADLEAMKEVGLGGAFIVNVKSPDLFPDYPNPAKQLSPEWFEIVKHSVNEADRLGLKLGVHISDGFALAGGPWITPQESMQKVVFTDTLIAGGNIRSLTLQQPETVENYYEDIALLAYRVPQNVYPELETRTHPIITTSSLIDTVGGFYRADAKRVSESKSDKAWIQYEYPEPYTCRNIEITKLNNNYQAQRLTVMASDDGINFRLVKKLVPARHGWQNYDFNDTHAIPPTTARYFRFYWDPAGSEPGSEDLNYAKWKPNLKIEKIILHTEPRIHHWEGKAGYIWRVAQSTTPFEISDSDCIRKEDIIDLTSYMKNGVVTATLPQGTWKLLRVGHTSNGHTNETAGGGKGLECDKFSREAVKKQFDHWFGAIYQSVSPEVARRTIKYLYIDSWECGSQNWSEDFPAQFKARRGYDLMPYLPLFAGIPMESVVESEKVLRDIRTTIAELVVDVFYDVLENCAREYDCEFTAENVAPTMVSDGMMHFKKVDLPMGEFWLRTPTHDKLNDMLDAISGGRIYGKNIIQAEAFTEVRGTWDEHPGMLKSMLDRNYSFGINRMVYHVYVHNPYMDRKPGMTLDGIGLFFQRDQTWWPNGAKAFVDYAARCQALLQYGHPVTDIAVFTGEEIPRRAMLPDRLVPSLPGLFGAERVESERKRLENKNIPLRSIVGVTHTANMADPDKWVNPLRGYAYDSFNLDALLNLATIENGRMTFPGGTSYRVVVLPLPHPMSPDSGPISEAVMMKLQELHRAGVIVPKLPYKAQDFTEYQLERDLIVPADVAWTHRSGEEADIYFIANQKDQEVAFSASMRIGEGKPQLWNPMTGEITSPADWTQNAGRTVVPLRLQANESVFIVFPKGNAHPLVVGETPETNSRIIPLEVKEWDISFPAINRKITREQLFDWSKEEDDQLKYYSGTANYTTTFKWKGKPKGRIYLSLGEIANVATVRLNGVDCGTVWTAPYRIELTQALRKGKNELEIIVANTWANAIKGRDKGKAPFEGIWTNAKYRMSEDILVPSGLFGPLELINYR